jgi:hypothetical protein
MEPAAAEARPQKPSTASAPAKGSAEPVAVSTAVAATASKAARAASAALMLDLEAVADVEGLAEEVAMLRASIRELAHPHGDLSEHVKILAELRHQVEALCSTLKTQQTLEGDGGRKGGVSQSDMTRMLDELGDRLGVSR